MKKFIPICLLPLLGFLLLSACSSTPSWLEGSWQIDQDRTQKEATPPTSGNAKGPAGLFPDLSGMMISMVLPQLQGMQVIITRKDRMTLIQGQGKSMDYQVVLKSPDKCTLKLQDGTVETYYRDGDEIYSYSTGSSPFKIYLQRQR